MATTTTGAGTAYWTRNATEWFLGRVPFTNANARRTQRRQDDLNQSHTELTDATRLREAQLRLDTTLGTLSDFGENVPSELTGNDPKAIRARAAARSTLIGIGRTVTGMDDATAQKVEERCQALHNRPPRFITDEDGGNPFGLMMSQLRGMSHTPSEEELKTFWAEHEQRLRAAHADLADKQLLKALAPAAHKAKGTKALAHAGQMLRRTGHIGVQGMGQVMGQMGQGIAEDSGTIGAVLSYVRTAIGASVTPMPALTVGTYHLVRAMVGNRTGIEQASATPTGGPTRTDTSGGPPPSRSDGTDTDGTVPKPTLENHGYANVPEANLNGMTFGDETNTPDRDAGSSESQGYQPVPEANLDGVTFERSGEHDDAASEQSETSDRSKTANGFAPVPEKDWTGLRFETTGPEGRPEGTGAATHAEEPRFAAVPMTDLTNVTMPPPVQDANDSWGKPPAQESADRTDTETPVGTSAPDGDQREARAPRVAPDLRSTPRMQSGHSIFRPDAGEATGRLGTALRTAHPHLADRMKASMVMNLDLPGATDLQHSADLGRDVVIGTSASIVESEAAIAKYDALPSDTEKLTMAMDRLNHANAVEHVVDTLARIRTTGTTFGDTARGSLQPSAAVPEYDKAAGVDPEGALPTVLDPRMPIDTVAKVAQTVFDELPQDTKEAWNAVNGARDTSPASIDLSTTEGAMAAQKLLDKVQANLEKSDSAITSGAHVIQRLRDQRGAAGMIRDDAEGGRDPGETEDGPKPK